MKLFKPIPQEKKDTLRAKNQDSKDAAQAKREETRATAVAKKETKNRTNAVSFLHAEYLGGLPNTKPCSGTLFIGNESIGIGAFGPKKGIVKWSDAVGISFDSDTAKKSRVGKAMLVGVFALAAKKTQDEAIITVSLKDGNAALYEVKGIKGAAVRGKIQALFTAAGVPCLDDASILISAESSIPEKIAQLAQLHEAGILSEAEFTEKKMELLSRM